MTGVSRRGMLGSLGGVILLAGSGLGRPLAASRSIVIPARDFILRRELERGLAGGASLIVTREWRGRFEKGAAGTLVTGEQIMASVEAPEHLSPIAEIERNRRATGPFPARLDANGYIIDSEPEQAEGKAAAVRAAMSLLEEAGRSAGELEEARKFLARLTEAAGAVISAIPADLFFPQVGEARDVRKMAVPGDIAGEVTVELSARSGIGGLLDSFERRITTRIGNDSRLSRETWRLRLA